MEARVVSSTKKSPCNRRNERKCVMLGYLNQATASPHRCSLCNISGNKGATLYGDPATHARWRSSSIQLCR